MTDDKTEQGFYGQSRAKVGYDRCNNCNGVIKWIQDAKGRFYPSIPGSDTRHQCRPGYKQNKNKEREGYL